MKRNLIALFVATTAILLSSCGGENKQNEQVQESEMTKTVRPLNVKLQGDLADYFEIVDKDYKVTKEAGGFATVKFNIEIKRLDKALPLNAGEEIATYSSDNGLLLGYNVEIFDENGDFIKKIDEGHFKEDIAMLNPGETGFLKVESYVSVYFEGDEFEKFAKFRLTSTLKHNLVESSDTSSTDSETADADEDPSDDEFDKALDKAAKKMDKELDKAAKKMDKALDDAANALNDLW